MTFLQVHFLSRSNRFLIRCKWNGRTISAFLPNPGRLQELLFPGTVLVYLVEGGKISTSKDPFYGSRCGSGRSAHYASHTRTNEVARYLLQKGKIPGLDKARIVKSEVQMGRNRFDFLLKEGNKEFFWR